VSCTVVDMNFGIWANKIREELDEISSECFWWKSQQINVNVGNKMFHQKYNDIKHTSLQNIRMSWTLYCENKWACERGLIVSWRNERTGTVGFSMWIWKLRGVGRWLEG
jgi:hypothetical protein